MMRQALAIVLCAVAGFLFAASGAAEQRVTGDTIRDRIRARMERTQRERAPDILGKTTATGTGAEIIDIQGKPRSFVRFTPNKVLVGGKPAPVVFALHGGKGSAERLAGYLGLNALAEKEGFIAVYPQGEQRRWNDGRPATQTGGGRASTANDVAFLNGLADALVAQNVADPARIYVLGISNGGFMALSLACSGTSRFAGFAAVIASLPLEAAQTCQPKGPVPVLMINGTDDRLVRFDGKPGRFGIQGNMPPPMAVKHFAALGGCTSEMPVQLPDTDPKDATRVTATTWSGCNPGSQVMFYRVEGGGHQPPRWSRSPALAEFFLGRTSHDIDTAEASWVFFRGIAH